MTSIVSCKPAIKRHSTQRTLLIYDDRSVERVQASLTVLFSWPSPRRDSNFAGGKGLFTTPTPSVGGPGNRPPAPAVDDLFSAAFGASASPQRSPPALIYFGVVRKEISAAGIAYRRVGLRVAALRGDSPCGGPPQNNRRQQTTDVGPPPRRPKWLSAVAGISASCPRQRTLPTRADLDMHNARPPQIAHPTRAPLLQALPSRPVPSRPAGRYGHRPRVLPEPITLRLL